MRMAAYAVMNPRSLRIPLCHATLPVIRLDFYEKHGLSLEHMRTLINKLSRFAQSLQFHSRLALVEGARGYTVWQFLRGSSCPKKPLRT